MCVCSSVPVVAASVPSCVVLHLPYVRVYPRAHVCAHTPTSISVLGY